MDKIEISDKAVNAFASSAERLIGYLYAGMLPLIILTIERQENVASFVHATGGILVVIMTVSVGIGIYTVYFRIIGELFLYPIQHGLHMLIDVLTLKKGNNRTSTIGLLVSYGVPISRCRDAYESIKDTFFIKEEKTRLQVDHGELHILYLTATISFFTYIVLNNIINIQTQNYYLWLALITITAAFIGDTRQHSREASMIRTQEIEIKKFLNEKGFI